MSDSAEQVQRTESADGTSIAYRTLGSGRPVVLVGGALSTAAAFVPMAQALAAAGLQGVGIERRGRGDSGDTQPYAPEREVEDLRAVIEAVGDDSGEASGVVVLGHSSGAVLALFAAESGVPMSQLFLSEPPLRFGEDEPPADLAARLQSLVDDGHGDEAVLTFMRENVRLPDAAIDAFRDSPGLAPAAAIAQTTVYDTELVAAVDARGPGSFEIGVPVIVLRGDPADPVIVAATDTLSAALPAELVVVPESKNHSVDPAATVREILARIG